MKHFTYANHNLLPNSSTEMMYNDGPKFKAFHY